MSDYLNQLFSLNGKTAVVIGGTGELCGAMAEGLASAGAEVVLVGRSKEKAEARLKSIEAAGGKAWFLPCEVDKRDQLEKLLEWDRIYEVNIKGVFLACQVFGKYFVQRGEGGSIINVGSMSGVIPLSRVFTYSTTKAAVHNLSKNLAREWAEQNIRVNTLVPGFFPAEQNKKVLTLERVGQIMGHTPMNRFGEAKELIGATILLASDAGSFMTGTETVVDGGYAAMTI